MSPSTTATSERPSAKLAFFVDLEPPAADFLADAVDGLTRPQKSLPPKHFYDEEGSRLFDEICETKEYYVTRTEIALLETIGPEIARKAGRGATVVEFGSGSSVKIRTVLDALDAPGAYLALDISRTHLLTAAKRIARDYPRVSVGAVCADFTRPLRLPPEATRSDTGMCLGFLPGSTIGNFAPREAVAFLRATRDLLGPGGALLIGVDLKKDKAVLDAAYNDTAGVTAAFNLNLLARMNRELDAGLDLDRFDHVAFYDPEKGRVEMHLKSRRDQRFKLDGAAITLDAGETIHTENSYKYAVDEFQEAARTAGFVPENVWTDPDRLFSLHWLSVPA